MGTPTVEDLDGEELEKPVGSTTVDDVDEGLIRVMVDLIVEVKVDVVMLVSVLTYVLLPEVMVLSAGQTVV